MTKCVEKYTKLSQIEKYGEENINKISDILDRQINEAADISNRYNVLKDQYTLEINELTEQIHHEEKNNKQNQQLSEMNIRKKLVDIQDSRNEIQTTEKKISDLTKFCEEQLFNITKQNLI
ncbi:hypothetical protein A3Q56_05130 [Intoshia linei]|uniref:Uncharacterized protein n=1 Tax=Intoshia linei TaxID=1819745 RepID=A0A177AYP6_9BILA|nr:hypothetical protein A3Q56_05130 [Intoshia linei]